MRIFIFLLIGTLLVACNKKQKEIKWYDLSYAFDEKTVHWPNAHGFEIDTIFYGKTADGLFYSSFNFSSTEHSGTHMDAPIHFAEGKQTTDEVPVKNLIGNGIVVDVSARALADRDYQVLPQDFIDWEEKNGEIPSNTIVLIRTGQGKYYHNSSAYLGTDKMGNESLKDLHFPALHPSAAEWLVKKKIKAVGIDGPSIDYGQTKDYSAHRILLEQNIPIFENLANLEQLPLKDLEIIALPMKIKGGSGGPLRIVAREK